MAIRGSGLRQKNALDRVLGNEARARGTEGSWVQRIVQPQIEHLRDSTHMSQGSESAIRMKLMRAGFPYGLTAKEFLLMKKAFALGVPALALCFNGFATRLLPFLNLLGLAQWFIIGVCAAVVGYIGPDFWLVRQMMGRKKAMQRSLPDVVDLICVSVEAGLGLVAAMQEVATRFRGPMGDELMRVIAELRVGKTFAQALRDMDHRLGIEDLSQFVSQIVMAEQLGISVGNALRAQADIMRERRRQRAEEQAQKAPVKMMVPLILFILPTLFIVIMGPAAIMAWQVLSAQDGLF